MTPRFLSPSDKEAILLYAPRSLKAPIGCWFSGLRKRRRSRSGSEIPRSRKSGKTWGTRGSNSIKGVRVVMPWRRERAEWMLSRVIIRGVVSVAPWSLELSASITQAAGRNSSCFICGWDDLGLPFLVFVSCRLLADVLHCKARRDSEHRRIGFGAGEFLDVNHLRTFPGIFPGHG